jgi:hypothetical protein
MEHMRRILVFFLLIELLATAFYCWSAWQWFDWRAVGPNAFPGSPDAFFYAHSAFSDYLRAQGFMLGGILGGVAVAFLVSISHGAQITKSTRALQISIVLLPVAVLASVYVIGARV